MSFFPSNQDSQGNGLFAPGGSGGDAFHRVRTGDPFQLFAFKQDFHAQNNLMGNITATGGTVTYNNSSASSTLAVTASSGSRAVRQSLQYIPYQSGKSTIALLSGVMGATVTNCSKRIGLFDNSNGLFFQQAGSTKQVVVRKAAVDTAIDQTSWNLDKLDGTGLSGKTVDWTKAQVFVIDFQWLGVGRVRFGMDIDGELIYCHEVRNANTVTSVYMRTPNLPIRYEIINTAAASVANLEAICAAVHVEGGFDKVGFPFGMDMGTGGKSINTSLTPLIRLRNISGRERAPIQVTSMQIISQSASTYQWMLLLNPTVTGGTGPTYNAVNTNSNFEFDIASTGTASGGTKLASGYSASSDREANFNFGEHNLGLFGANAAGTRDELVLALVTIAGGSTTYNASLGILEYP